MIRAVLLDAAGTLIALREPVGESYARVAREHGVSLPAWRLEDAFGRILASAEPMVFPDAGSAEIPGLERAWWRRQVRATFRAADSSVRFGDFEAFFAALWTLFASPRAWQARPGSEALLRRLHAQGIRSAVVSNFDLRLPALLDSLGLGRWLEAVVLPSAARAAKPDPRIFAHALKALGVSPDEAVFVGDDAQRDLAGARAAGLEAIDVAGLATLDELRLPDRGDA